MVELTQAKGYSKADLKTKVNEKGTGLEYQLQIILPNKEEYW